MPRSSHRLRNKLKKRPLQNLTPPTLNLNLQRLNLNEEENHSAETSTDHSISNSDHLDFLGANANEKDSIEPPPSKRQRLIHRSHVKPSSHPRIENKVTSNIEKKKKEKEKEIKEMHLGDNAPVVHVHVEEEELHPTDPR